MSSGDAAPRLELRVNEYKPTVRDFERDAAGAPIKTSLRGPARTEALKLSAREALVAYYQREIVAEQVAACYFRHGPNAPELCRELGEAYMRMRADAPGAMGLHGKVFSRVLKAPRVPNYTPDYVPGREAVAPGV